MLRQAASATDLCQQPMTINRTRELPTLRQIRAKPEQSRKIIRITNDGERVSVGLLLSFRSHQRVHQRAADASCLMAREHSKGSDERDGVFGAVIGRQRHAGALQLPAEHTGCISRREAEGG